MCKKTNMTLLKKIEGTSTVMIGSQGTCLTVYKIKTEI